MAKVSDSSKSPAEKTKSANPPVDGPHSYKARKAAEKESQKEGPAYVISVTPHEEKEGDAQPKEKSVYNPQELRAKARGFLKSGNLTPKEKSILAEILGPEEES